MRKADNLPPSCAVVMKSWSLNYLEPSGPVQACNGTALPFYMGLGVKYPLFFSYFNETCSLSTYSREKKIVQLSYFIWSRVVHADGQT